MFTLLLGLTALSALSARPYLLADTSTTPTAPSDETAQPPAEERVLTPCEAARENLAAARRALALAEAQVRAARSAVSQAVEVLITLVNDPNATAAQKKAAEESIKRAQEAQTLAEAVVVAVQEAVNVAQALVDGLCAPEPKPEPEPLPRPPIVDVPTDVPTTAEPHPADPSVTPTVEACCGS